MPAVAPGALDRLPQEGHHRRVALVEVEGHHLAVAVDPERQLGQVVGADREPVEPPANSSIRITFEGISHIT